MKPKNSRIHFADEERASPELKKPICKADKAAGRVDAVRKKARLRFDEDAPKVPSKLTHVILALNGFAATSERMERKEDADKLQDACINESGIVKSVEHREKGEKPPLLYDLTTLQRDANRLLGYTAQQTLDYTQSLYEKKLCTYPRTDSRFVTEDMAVGLPVLVNVIAKAMPLAAQIPVYAEVGQLVNSAKVTDHHAIIPTMTVQKSDLAALPAGERAILHTGNAPGKFQMIARRTE